MDWQSVTKRYVRRLLEDPPWLFWPAVGISLFVLGTISWQYRVLVRENLLGIIFVGAVNVFYSDPAPDRRDKNLAQLMFVLATWGSFFTGTIIQQTFEREVLPLSMIQVIGVALITTRIIAGLLVVFGTTWRDTPPALFRDGDPDTYAIYTAGAILLVLPALIRDHSALAFTDRLVLSMLCAAILGATVYTRYDSSKPRLFP